MISKYRRVDFPLITIFSSYRFAFDYITGMTTAGFREAAFGRRSADDSAVNDYDYFISSSIYKVR